MMTLTTAAATTTFRSDVLAGARILALVAVGAALASSCKNRADERALASAHVAPAPLPPADLALEVFVPRPLEFWSLLRPLLGPAGELLPRGPELALGTAIGLSPIVATALDLRSPVVAAVRIDGQRPGVVLGAHLVSGDELVASLTTGNAPSHRVERRGELRFLAPVSGEPTTGSVAVLDDTLLAGTSADMAALGPYVARAMTKRPMPEPPTAAIFAASGAALRSTLVPFLRNDWERRRTLLERSLALAEREQGRAADLADPGAVLRGLDASAGDVFSALASARKLEARLIPEANRLMLDAEFGAGAPVTTTLSNVPLDTLSAAPEGALLRVSFGRHASEVPAELGAGLRNLFGARLSEKDYSKLEEAIALVEAGRGRTQAFAVRADGAFVWVGDVTDRKKLEDGLERSLSLVQSGSFVAPLASLLGAVRIRPARRAVRGLAVGARGATVEVASPASAKGSVPAPPPRKLELVWAVRDRDYAVVLAPEAVPVLEALLDGRAKPEDEVALLAPIAEAAVAGVVDFGALPLVTARAPGKSLAFALTASPDVFRLRVAASPGAVGGLTRMLP